jgi:hypothetical protein
MDRPVRRPRLINRRQQGDLGELSAMRWLANRGAVLWLPFGHSPDADLLAQVDDSLLRIQVKTSTFCRRASDGCDRWCVQVATNGGNQSWAGVAKRFDPGCVDYLFALVGDGRRWLIPASAIDGETNITLGGVKYSEFEIERDEPIMSLVYAIDGTRSRIDKGRGSAGVGEPGSAVNRVAPPEGVRIPPPPSVGPQDPQEESLALRRTGARTRISRNHQVTIPMSAFRAADLRPGDRLQVLPTGPGRVELVRVDELVDQIALLPDAVRSADG